MWVILAFISALLLGAYDILKKLSLRGNPVLPVLFLASLTGALVFLPLILFSRFYPEIAGNTFFYIPPADFRAHFFIFLKSCLVGSSWILSYYAMKNLSISIVSPVRATGPLWTLIGALLIFGERLGGMQWFGLILSLVFFWYFSFAAREEGLSFLRNRWMFCIYAGTLLSAMSGLYDKFLIREFGSLMVQSWFSLYMIPVLFPFLILHWYPKRKKEPFRWRASIPLIGLCLVVADFLYFYALSDPQALISIVSAVRRSSAIVPFVVGVIFFREKCSFHKVIALLGMLLGICLIVAGS